MATKPSASGTVQNSPEAGVKVDEVVFKHGNEYKGEIVVDPKRPITFEPYYTVKPAPTAIVTAVSEPASSTTMEVNVEELSRSDIGVTTDPVYGVTLEKSTIRRLIAAGAIVTKASDRTRVTLTDVTPTGKEATEYNKAMINPEFHTIARKVGSGIPMEQQGKGDGSEYKPTTEYLPKVPGRAGTYFASLPTEEVTTPASSASAPASGSQAGATTSTGTPSGGTSTTTTSNPSSSTGSSSSGAPGA